MKIQLSYEIVKEEISLLSRRKDEVSKNIELMVNYNQGLIVGQTDERYKQFNDLGLILIEGLIFADILEHYSNITKATKTPIQFGENVR